VYQVYVRSFADGDGDGIGDLEGLRSRLDHIASLGVDAIWLNPIYPSPQRDHGYDVADYFTIDPVYGDLAGFDRLVADASARGLRVVMDIVPNHCSDQHPWFQAAVAAPAGTDERGRFYFRDGRDGGPPNNWAAAFGGSAWTPLDGGDGQWYLGTFTPYQPTSTTNIPTSRPCSPTSCASGPTAVSRAFGSTPSTPSARRPGCRTPRPSDPASTTRTATTARKVTPCGGGGGRSSTATRRTIPAAT
jgi:hypothetical protein